MRYALESGRERLKGGSKWAVAIRLGTTTGLGSFLENHSFDPFFEVPNWPIFKAFLPLRGAKIAQHGLKMGSFHLFVHPK